MGTERALVKQKKAGMEFHPNLGLEAQAQQGVINVLNIILADEVVLTQKTRNAHWNASGASFYELHLLFDVQYNELNDAADEVAERVRMLGGTAIGSLQEFIHFTRLDENPGVIPVTMDLLADHEASIRSLREDAKKCSEEFEDEGTTDLLISLIRLHEKMAWMLRSYRESEVMVSKDQKKTL